MDGTKSYWKYVSKKNIKIPIFVDLKSNPTCYTRYFLGNHSFDDGVFLLNCFGCKNIRLHNCPKRSAYWGYYGDNSMMTILLGEFLIPGCNHESFYEVLYSLKHKYYNEEN